MSDWKYLRLIDVSSVITKGATPTSYGFDYVAEGVGFFRVNNILDTGGLDCSNILYIDDRTHKFLSRSQLQKNDVLLSIAGTIGRAAVVQSIHLPANCNQAIGIIRLNEGVSPNFLARLLTSGQGKNLIAADTVQLAQANFSLGQIRKLVFRVPPYEEQEAIAKILDTLDTAIHQTEAIIAKLKAVKQGLLHDLLTRGIDANGELRPPQSEAPQLYKESPLGWIPQEWDVETVIELTISSVIGPFGSDLVASDYRDSGVPVIFVRDIKPDCLQWKSNVYVSTGKAQALAAHEAIAGDVIATKMGLPPCVAAVYPSSMQSGIVTADIVRLRPDVSRIKSNWMSTFINSSSVAKQVEQITAGVTRPKVTLHDVRNLLLAVPAMSEQDRMLERMAAIESRIHLEEAELEKYSAKKSGLMDDLLTGRVRVTPLLEQVARSGETASA